MFKLCSAVDLFTVHNSVYFHDFYFLSIFYSLTLPQRYQRETRPRRVLAESTYASCKTS